MIEPAAVADGSEAEGSEAEGSEVEASEVEDAEVDRAEMEDGEDASPRGPRPRFVCIGSSAAGGAWLYRQAASHPTVWVPPIPKFNFFRGRWDRTRATALDRLGVLVGELYRGEAVDPRDIELLRRVWYDTADDMGGDPYVYRQLMNVGGASAVGVVAPKYEGLRAAGARALVAEFPKTKFVYFVLDPVTRLWEDVRGEVDAGRAAAAVTKDPDALAELVMSEKRIDPTAQSQVVERWTSIAGDRFAVFRLDDPKTPPAAVRRAVFDHCGLSAERCTASPSWRGLRNDQPPEHLRDLLVELVGDEAERLERAVAGPQGD